MRDNGYDTTPRMVPLVCGLLTLIGAVVWTEAVILVGLALVALWAPVAALVAGAADKMEAGRVVDTVQPPLHRGPAVGQDLTTTASKG
jgi:hypothetical protein